MQVDTYDPINDVVAPGTSPRQLAAIVGCLALPRRTPAQLRHAVVDAGVAADRPRQLAELARDIGAAPPEVTGAIIAAWQQRGVRVAIVGDGAYPDRLANGWPELGPPVLLAWRGANPARVPTVAIVGARHASPYGREIARWLAAEVASAGGHVIAGGAVGIDAAAHRGAIDQPGGTSVVLGSGHNVNYPQAHARDDGLFEQVVVSGGTLYSELLPHERPHAGNVRARNRIIAALADVVVIVEGASRSGALITANAAAEWGRVVLAVPGDVRARGSVAPHRLLHEGAGPCRKPQDVLDMLRLEVPASGHMRRSNTDETADVRHHANCRLPGVVLNELADRWPRPVSTAAVADIAALPTSALLAILTDCQIAGHVTATAHGIMLRGEPVRGAAQPH